MKEIRVAAGQRMAVVRRAFSSVPVDYRFDARAERSGEALAGVVEVRKSQWIVPGTPVQHPLEASNVVSAGMWNTFMSVDVVPAIDAIITLERRRIRYLWTLLLMSLLVVAVAAAMIVMFRA
jgi:hypothetical protein